MVSALVLITVKTSTSHVQTIESMTSATVDCISGLTSSGCRRANRKEFTSKLLHRKAGSSHWTDIVAFDGSLAQLDRATDF